MLFVRDVHAATKHYRDAMGFSFGDIFGEPPSFAILKRDNMYVMVKQIEDHKHIVPRWTISAGLWDMYFWVDDVDALYKEFVERGAKIDYGLCDQPYGCREFGTQDIDGHDIGFGQVISDRPERHVRFVPIADIRHWLDHVILAIDEASAWFSTDRIFRSMWVCS